MPRVSATPIETDDWQPAYQPMYSSDRHSSLQNADPVQVQLQGILTARPLTGFRAVQSVRLEADELLAAGESLVLQALPERANLILQASVTDLATGAPAIAPVTMRRDADEVHHAEVPPLPPGDYRVRVEGVGDSARLADPVHGLVCVLDDVVPDVDPAADHRRMTDEPRRRVYALLVGIDAYLPPINPLWGCRNDIAALEQYLRARVGAELALRTLYDDEATRDAVIAGFRDHLAQAAVGDTALFVYAGHGSEEPAPAEVASLEATGRIQTLMLHDCGRRVGRKLRRALADKELAVLLSEVAERGPHIAVILDCCHSGSGTRDPFVGIRGWVPDPAAARNESDRNLLRELGAARPSTDFIPGALDGWVAPNAPTSRSPRAVRSRRRRSCASATTHGERSRWPSSRRSTRSARARRTARCSTPCAHASSGRRTSSVRSSTRSSPAGSVMRCSWTAPSPRSPPRSR